MGKDYYKILGVDKGSSQDEIKKAFRKLAHEHHPDKQGGDEAKFKEINEAYQVLGDAKKRSQYDQFGSAFQNGQAGGASQGFHDFSGFQNGFSGDFEDLGEMFGGLGDMFGFGGGRTRSRGPRQGQNIEAVLTIEFNEAIFGTEKEINIRKKILCDHCHGNGAEPGTKVETCKTCGGHGRVTRVQRTILGNMQMQATCDDCGGEGKIYSEKCKKCSGGGAVMENVNMKVKIPAGINEGETIRLSGQGEVGEKGGRTGDLYLHIKVKGDSRFVRDGYDIKTKATISFTQAALGDKIEIDSIEGKVTLKIPAGTQSETVFKLKGKGVTKLRGSGKGDQYVKIQVKTPTSLSKRQRELLKELDE